MVNQIPKKLPPIKETKHSVVLFSLDVKFSNYVFANFLPSCSFLYSLFLSVLLVKYWTSGANPLILFSIFSIFVFLLCFLRDFLNYRVFAIVF